MLWHPVPSRAFSLHLRAGALTCSLLISFVIYKESTLFLGLSFWLHQGRIPHRFCRFNCCLAAHQRTRKKDSAEPSFAMEPRLRGSVDSTSSTRGDPLRRGILATAVYTNLGSGIPVQVDHPHFDVSFGGIVFGLRSLAFQSGCWAWVACFSLLGG